MDSPVPSVLACHTIVDASDSLDYVSRQGLMRKIRQLSVLVLSSGNRVACLLEQLQELEQKYVDDTDALRQRISCLERTVRESQDQIDFCLSEIDELQKIKKIATI